jgi:hypothetical protein
MFCFSFAQAFVVILAWGCCFVALLDRCHCCFALLLFEVVVVFLLLNLLRCSFCSTYYGAPLTWHQCSFCSTYYNALLVQRSILLFLFNPLALLPHTIVLLLLLALLLFLFNVVAHCSFRYLSGLLVILLFLIPFVQHCCFYSFCFRLVLL